MAKATVPAETTGYRVPAGKLVPAKTTAARPREEAADPLGDSKKRRADAGDGLLRPVPLGRGTSSQPPSSATGSVGPLRGANLAPLGFCNPAVGAVEFLAPARPGSGSPRDGKPAAKFATRCWVGGSELEKLLDSLNAEQLKRITWLEKPPVVARVRCAPDTTSVAVAEDHLVQAVGSRC